MTSDTPLSDLLIDKLRDRFADRAFDLGDPPEARIRFPAEHPDVGDVEIFDDVEELTVTLGKFTHTHIGNYDEGISDEEHADRITESVILLLRALFSDQLVLWGSQAGGGGYYLLAPNGPFPPDVRKYVWSGPFVEGE